MAKYVLVDCHSDIRDALGILLLNTCGDCKIIAMTKCYEEKHDVIKGFKINEALKQVGIDMRLIEGAVAPFVERRPRDGGPYISETRHSAPAGGYAWDIIYKKVKQYKGELTIMAFGPLTNVAIALLRYENLKDYVKEIIVCGGSTIYGDNGSFSEASACQDAYAYKVVLESGISVTIVGLNAVYQVLMSIEELKDIIPATTRTVGVANELLSYYQSRQFDGNQVPLPDTLAASMFLYPHVCETELFHVEVETSSSSMYGRTVADWRYYLPEPKETKIVVKVNHALFKNILADISTFYI